MSDVMTMSEQELRLEIARLKGWKAFVSTKKNLPIRVVWLTGDRYDFSPEFWQEANYHHALPPTETPFPDYPHDIAAAWDLVEEVWNAGARTSVSSPNGSDITEKVWHAYFTFRVCYVGEAETAPLAICRAYVAWRRSQ